MDEMAATDNDENDAQPPVISNEGYYWIGKDYVNTYKGESRDIADFSTGTKLIAYTYQIKVAFSHQTGLHRPVRSTPTPTHAVARRSANGLRRECTRFGASLHTTLESVQTRKGAPS